MEHQGIELILLSSGKKGYVWNNIVYGFRIGSGVGMNVPAPSASSLYVYNNTFYNCNMAFGTFYETLGTILINNIVQNCTEGFSSPNNALSDYNISDLALDAPGANSKNSATVIFVNAASENFHLSSSDTTARGAGTDLSGDLNLPFNDDIDGQIRVGLWDIGADQSAIASYRLRYTAGAHGSITGTSSQTVNSGSDGTAVTAVPHANYHFVQWSDGSTTNPRSDTNVAGNIIVTASFSPTAVKIGVYWNGSWYLDMDGNGAWNGANVDRVYSNFGQGLAGAIPVVGDWDGSGVTRIGVYWNGSWYLDMNGNGAWDGSSIDRVYPNFGQGLAGAWPVVGVW
jgi:hypothetical protein